MFNYALNVRVARNGSIVGSAMGKAVVLGSDGSVQASTLDEAERTDPRVNPSLRRTRGGPGRHGDESRLDASRSQRPLDDE